MKKQCINVVPIIGLMFLIGVLLTSVIISRAQHNKISIEQTTQAKSIIHLEKPMAIKHFTEEGATISNGGKFVEPIEHTTVAYPEKHNSGGSIVTPTTTIKEESTTVKEIEKEETNTIKADDSSKESPTEPEEDSTQEDVPVAETIINIDSYVCSLDEIYYVWPIREYTSEEKELIAKMLYCESRGDSWDGQVATCSAIINHIEYYGGSFSILNNSVSFEPAPYYMYETPNQMQYDVLDYVLSGHLIADIKYFRTDYYHDFGTPMFVAGEHYFSK